MRELVYATADKKGFVRRIYGLFTEHLAKNGLRLTDQRRRILDYLLEADHHLSQEEIYSALRKHGLGRATVFRTLRMLEESGLVNHVVGRKGTPLFEVNIERPHHDHLICVDCGRIQEVSWPKLEEIQESSCREAGFTPLWHRHEVFGRCSDCSKRRAAR